MMVAGLRYSACASRGSNFQAMRCLSLSAKLTSVYSENSISRSRTPVSIISLHLVGNQRFLDLRKALKHARDKNVPQVCAPRDVIGHRASQVASYGNIGHVEFALV